MVGMVQLMLGSVTPATPRVQLTDTSVNRTVAGGTAVATYRLDAAGTISKTVFGGGISVYETWLLSGVNSDYQVRATLLSGGPLSGTAGTWQACSTSRTWTVSDAVADANEVAASVLIEIRDVATTTVLTSATIAMSAMRSS